MARRFGRKPRHYRTGFIKEPGRTRRRIIIPQPPDRPIQVEGDLIDREFLDDDPWWFVKHRRGLRRKKVGGDPLEMRAVSELRVKGSLPERIVYQALVWMRMSPATDFDFQSSQQGGRLELGGLVADFLFHHKRMVIQVQGPTHEGPMRQRKDEEQEDILADMGFNVHYITDTEIYNQATLWRRLRQIFNFGPSGGGGGLDQAMTTISPDEWNEIMNSVQDLENML